MARQDGSRWLLLGSLLSFMLLLFSAIPVASQPSWLLPGCCNATLAPRGSVVNVAILVWGPPANSGHPLASQTVWPGNPLLHDPPWTGPSELETATLQGYLLWQEKMVRQDAGGDLALRMLGGDLLRLNITYVNAGPQAALVGEDEYAPVYQNSALHKVIRDLADANGPYGRMHFLLTPLVSNTAVSLLMALACEDSRTCMIIGSWKRKHPSPPAAAPFYRVC
jgi:hypothetical protein